MANVLRGLVARQRPEVVARDDALRQLLHGGFCKHRPQLWLADEHDLQQFAVMRLEIGQQPQLLEHVGAEVLCLVDDEHALRPARMSVK